MALSPSLMTWHFEFDFWWQETSSSFKLSSDSHTQPLWPIPYKIMSTYKTREQPGQPAWIGRTAWWQCKSLIPPSTWSQRQMNLWVQGKNKKEEKRKEGKNCVGNGCNLPNKAIKFQLTKQMLNNVTISTVVFMFCCIWKNFSSPIPALTSPKIRKSACFVQKKKKSKNTVRMGGTSV